MTLTLQLAPPFHGVEGEPSDFSKLPTFQVVAGADTFDMAPSSYLMPVGQDNGESVYMIVVGVRDDQILGQVFMSNFYTVFDWESTRPARARRVVS